MGPDTKENIRWREDIIDRFNQLHIWWWILGKNVSLYERFCNPFRSDNDPGCWLSVGIKKHDFIVLNDFANSKFHGATIFDAYMMANHCNFDKACQDIYAYCTNQAITPVSKPVKRSTSKTKSRSEIKFIPRVNEHGEVVFVKADAAYWKPRHISPDDLIQDGVYSVFKAFRRKGNSKWKEMDSSKTRCYAYTYPSGRVKLHYVDAPKDQRFVANVSAYDIGFINQIQPHTRLFISKSYKDAKQIQKAGHQVIFLQSEGISIPQEIYNKLNRMFQYIYIVYDTDKAGIEASNNLAKELNKTSDKVTYIAEYIPEKYGANDFDELILTENGKQKVGQVLQEIINKHEYDTINDTSQLERSDEKSVFRQKDRDNQNRDTSEESLLPF